MESFDKNPCAPELIRELSQDTKLSERQVLSVVGLLKSANTVPFIARYRKEATGNLDEVQIRGIEERFNYLTELNDRKKTVLQSIESQGKLSDELRSQVLKCGSKTELEDIYLPYKPKRKTRALIAREAGLLPLAEIILQQESDANPLEIAQSFVNAEKGVLDAAAALRGARDIVAEMVAETVEIRSYVRAMFQKMGKIASSKRDDVNIPTKFEQYYDFKEAISQIPSHRYLAIARGERENALRMNIEVDAEQSLSFARTIFGLKPGSSFAGELELAVSDAYKRLVAPSVETDICVELKMKSDKAAIEIFAENLRNILLAAPLGGQTVLGIDPGLRTGCKCAIVDQTGKYINHVTIFLMSDSGIKAAENMLAAFIERYQPSAIAIGNGTGGRETESFVRKLLVREGKKDLKVVAVSESGASVYSASELARTEFPDLDLTIRGAISIARRLQDPLSELVKVEPKALGVGQYQHDVYQPLLERKLNEVVESCVNQVGVELNTASAPLLSYVAGIGANVAQNIVAYREQQGPFKKRQDIKKVAGLGPRTFEQAAGFLRILGGENPLDASAVHPERYDVVERIAKDMGVLVSALVGNAELAKNIDLHKYADDSIGTLTLKDIVEELKKPGRDPRASFEHVAFRDDVNTIGDLKKGMCLEGIITNVTAFGAFVDIGVHQDGLIHISELSEQFVRDPASVAHAGDRIKVEVLEVDIARKRIALSARIGRKREGDKGPKSPSHIAPQKSSSRATLGSLAAFAQLSSSIKKRS